MWHSSFPADQAQLVIRSGGYPTIVAITNKLKLFVTDFHYNTTKKQFGYTLGLDNGLSVLQLYLDKDGEWEAHSVDQPICSPEWVNMSKVATSSNPRYLVTTLASETRKAGHHLKNKMENLLTNNIGSACNNLVHEAKKHISDEQPLSMVNEHDLHSALSVLFGHKAKIDLSPNTLSALQSRYNTYIQRMEQREAHSKTLDSVFNGVKWLVAARRNLCGNGECSYYVCAFDASKVGPAVRRGHWNTTDIMEFVVPIQMYRSLRHVPDTIQSELLGSFTMFKQYRQRNFPNVPVIDKDGFIPVTKFIMDSDSGAVAWTHLNAAFVMVDR
jgi:hypothetical protein